MTAHLLIMYPHPKDVKEFDRAYREEHLPYADLKLDRRHRRHHQAGGGSRRSRRRPIT